MAYNGYTNRSTWNVVLWLNNDERLYNAYQTQIQQRGKFTPKTARIYISRLWPAGCTPDGDQLSRVNWSEVAEALNE